MEFLGMAGMLALGAFVGYAAASFWWHARIERMGRHNDWAAAEAAAWKLRYEEAMELLHSATTSAR